MSTYCSDTLLIERYLDVEVLEILVGSWSILSLTCMHATGPLPVHLIVVRRLRVLLGSNLLLLLLNWLPLRLLLLWRHLHLLHHSLLVIGILRL